MFEFNGLMWRWTEALWASIEARKLTKLTLRQGGVGLNECCGGDLEWDEEFLFMHIL
jgi:hypothetical protein